MKMNIFDEEAFVREMAHAEKVQEQRKTVTFAGGHTYEIPECIYSNEISIKDDSNEK